jgi:hypothetical protein
MKIQIAERLFWGAETAILNAEVNEGLFAQPVLELGHTLGTHISFLRSRRIQVDFQLSGRHGMHFTDRVKR